MSELCPSCGVNLTPERNEIIIHSHEECLGYQLSEERKKAQRLEYANSILNSDYQDLFKQIQELEKQKPPASGNKTLYKKALTKWGTITQLGMAQEECGELITAINQYLRGRLGKERLAEEVADVEIMCGQLRLFLGEELVDKVKKEKHDKLSHMLDE